MAAPLHHRADLDDIRSAYDSSDYDSERSYQRSQCGSDRSYTTALTQHSAGESKRPPRIHYNTCVESQQQEEHVPRYFADQPTLESPRSSVESYTSSLMSEEDNGLDELTEFEVPEYSTEPHASSAIAATPSDFSELFPSHRRLLVRHDDSTLDGNMNLRVDTEVTMHGGRRRDMTLFHLRMHDLRDREFSLRRYCRDSGREVCHTGRKLQNAPSDKRPGFQRSLSNALSAMRSKSYDQKGPTLASLKRHDSGYASLGGGSIRSSMDMSMADRPGSISEKPQSTSTSNTVKLEFSNYAQIAVTRTGSKNSKRYDFEYWGVQYAWKRIVRKHGLTRSVSFHLTKSGSSSVLAYIVPLPLSPAHAEEERSKGGWIPACSMWLADESLVRSQKDISDVVISSGLIALVDNCIKERFHSKDCKHIMVPKLPLGIEYVGPRRLINEMFKRSSSSRPSSSSGYAAQRTPKSAVTAVIQTSSDG